MSNAKVLSLEALQEFHSRLQAFRLGLLKEIENLELELRRLTQWVDVDANHYWSSEHQNIRRRLSEYMLQLSRCMSYVRSDERKPCTEEKKQVAKAKERAILCENKLQTQKAAATHWESRRNKVRTKIQRARDLAESEMIVALGRLQRYIDQLEAYRRVSSVGGFAASNAENSPNSVNEPATPSEQIQPAADDKPN